MKSKMWQIISKTNVFGILFFILSAYCAIQLLIFIVDIDIARYPRSLKL